MRWIWALLFLAMAVIELLQRLEIEDGRKGDWVNLTSCPQLQWLIDDEMRRDEKEKKARRCSSFEWWSSVLVRA